MGREERRERREKGAITRYEAVAGTMDEDGGKRSKKDDPDRL